MNDETIRSYNLTYPRGTNVPFWVDLCPSCVARRLVNGASILERRRPVTASRCADCDPEGSLRS